MAQGGNRPWKKTGWEVAWQRELLLRSIRLIAQGRHSDGLGGIDEREQIVSILEAADLEEGASLRLTN